MLEQAQRTFDSGACEHAKRLAEELERLSARFTGLRLESEARLKGIDLYLARLQGPMEAAGRVTFAAWLRRWIAERAAPSSRGTSPWWVRLLSASEGPLVPAGMIEGPLPDWQACLRDVRAGTPSATPQTPPAAAAERRGTGRDASAPVVSNLAKSSAAPHAIASAQPSLSRSADDPMPDENSLRLMELTIQFFFAVARADGPVSVFERELIRKDVCRQFADNRALLNRAESLCAHYECAAIDFQECCRQINVQFSAAHRDTLIHFASKLVDKRSVAAISFAHELCQRLGVDADVPPSEPVVAKSAIPVATFAKPPPTSTPATPRPPVAALARPSRPPVVVAAVSNPSASTVPSSPAQVPANENKQTEERDETAKMQPERGRSHPKQALREGTAEIKRQLLDETQGKAQTTRTPPVTSPASSSSITTPIAQASLSVPTPTLNECRALLEIPSATTLSADVIRRQWNLLSQRLAPEKVAAMGPEFVTLAHTKLGQLRRSAELLLASINEKLQETPPTPAVADLRHNPDLDEAFGGI
jgi:hypothetical protein